MYDVAVIGCGIVGASAAYELSKYNLKVAVLEKENDVACHTTRANSAIIHAGYDPEPGTLMAKLNVEGSAMVKEISQKLNVPYNQIGSLVLAFSQEDDETIKLLYKRGVENGVKGLSILSKEQLHQFESNISLESTSALYAPTAAIVSPWELCLALAQTAVVNGCDLLLESEVTSIDAHSGIYTIKAGKNTIKAKYIINAAGVYADKVHSLAGGGGFTIFPSKGEYYLFDKSQGEVVHHVVFQCPSKSGKGVLVSPTVHGNLIAGPDAQNGSGREEFSVTREGLEFVRQRCQKSVPSISFSQSIRNFAGLRANSDRDDFIIEESGNLPNFINLAGIKSPGLSAAPAIAVMAVDILGRLGLQLEKKSSFKDTREKVSFKELSPGERVELIKRNPSYGRVICRCETITEGEILDCLDMPIPPVSIDGVKRRCGAGMGRCQGGFCGPRVHELISKRLGIPMAEVVQDIRGSVIITGETKEGAAANE